MFKLPSLPYALDALEPHISKEIMELHYVKHHGSYVDNLNKALQDHPKLAEKPIEELIKNLNDLPETIKTAVRNHGGGHLNHSLFWESMTPHVGGSPSLALAKTIEETFGSFEQFKNTFNDAGLKRFGSGWVWLVQNHQGDLEIISTANQDNPITDGYKIILGNDVWEHAYYLQYKNLRAEYLKNWWNVVNWEIVNKRYN